MDELSAGTLRDAASTANLRRAFGAPIGGDLPSAFALLLRRLDGADARDPGRGERRPQGPCPGA